MSVTWYVIVMAIIAATVCYVAYNFLRIRKMSEDEDSAESADELLNEDDDQDIDDEEALSSI